MRYIVEDKTGNPKHALFLVQQVIDDGLVSKANGIKHYCWHTVFNLSDGEYHVSTRRRRTKDSAHSFIVYKEE